MGNPGKLWGIAPYGPGNCAIPNGLMCAGLDATADLPQLNLIGLSPTTWHKLIVSALLLDSLCVLLHPPTEQVQALFGKSVSFASIR